MISIININIIKNDVKIILKIYNIKLLRFVRANPNPDIKVEEN